MGKGAKRQHEGTSPSGREEPRAVRQHIAASIGIVRDIRKFGNNIQRDLLAFIGDPSLPAAKEITIEQRVRIKRSKTFAVAACISYIMLPHLFVSPRMVNPTREVL